MTIPATIANQKLVISIGEYNILSKYIIKPFITIKKNPNESAISGKETIMRSGLITALSTASNTPLIIKYKMLSLMVMMPIRLHIISPIQFAAQREINCANCFIIVSAI
jgi:hypothetical protein